MVLTITPIMLRVKQIQRGEVGPYSLKVLVLKCGAQLEAVEMAMRSDLHSARAAALRELLRMTRPAWVTPRTSEHT